MYDNLPELINHFPLGSRIKIGAKRDDYADGKFMVDGYLYTNKMWYPAHRKWDGQWEIYEG